MKGCIVFYPFEMCLFDYTYEKKEYPYMYQLKYLIWYFSVDERIKPTYFFKIYFKNYQFNKKFH